MEKETEDYIMQLEKRLVLLEGRVAMLEARLAGMTPVPSVPAAPWPQPYKPVSPTLQQNCPVCGITFIDSLGRPIALGYACNRNNCPSGVRYSTGTSLHGTVSVPYNTGDKVATYGTLWIDNQKIQDTDAKGTWAGISQLEPHLQSNDIQWSMGGSTTSYAWDPISQGNKKI